RGVAQPCTESRRDRGHARCLIRHMRKVLLLHLLALVSACSSSTPSTPLATVSDGGSDASTASDAAVSACPPLGDAGFARLEDLPVQDICAQVPHGLGRWTTECHGSIIVVHGDETDCSSYWLFDATTHALQATGHECNCCATCTGGVSGFLFPRDCFDGVAT